MRRFLWFLVCAILGVALLICGLLVPAHLRAVDVSVIQLAGQGTSALVGQGLTLAYDGKVGAAQLLLQAARQERIPSREKFERDTLELARQHPRWEVWGVPEPRFESIFEPDKRLPDSGSESFTRYLLREPNRDRVLALLRSSPRPLVQQLLLFRQQTNTVLIPPALSSAGQVMDTALCVCGLLDDNGSLTPALDNALFTLAAEGNRGNTRGLEQALMDVLSLAQRFNWGQLVLFLGQVQDPETVRLLAGLLRKEESQAPILFSAVHLSSNPARVARYLTEFGETGYKDLGASLKFGAGGVNELLARNQRLCVSPWAYQLALECCRQAPWLAMAVKWLLYLGAGFALAAAFHFGRRPASTLELPLQVRGFHIAREILFALGFLLVVLLITEPFLAEETQRIEFPFRVALPGIGTIVAATANQTNHSVHSTFMNKLSLLTLLLFFVLQALLYTASLLKLAEIRRQRVPPRIKLRLLENEDHLFDAGLYLGFVGTIISLILVSLGVIKPSLMAAYSSTSFGIIFVSIFKIFHLRPVRRKLLLEAEVESAQETPTGAVPRLVTP